jgi:trehalose synthase
VASVPECAEAILRLLRDPERADHQAAAGRERVREHFLLPRLLLNEVGLVAELLQRRPAPEAGILRDPVCGMALLPQGADVPTERHAGQVFAFCSEGCRMRFRRDPDRYVGRGQREGPKG